MYFEICGRNGLKNNESVICINIDCGTAKCSVDLLSYNLCIAWICCGKPTWHQS